MTLKELTEILIIISNHPTNLSNIAREAEQKMTSAVISGVRLKEIASIPSSPVNDELKEVQDILVTLTETSSQLEGLRADVSATGHFFLSIPKIESPESASKTAWESVASRILCKHTEVSNEVTILLNRIDDISALVSNNIKQAEALLDNKLRIVYENYLSIETELLTPETVLFLTKQNDNYFILGLPQEAFNQLESCPITRSTTCWTMTWDRLPPLSDKSRCDLLYVTTSVKNQLQLKDKLSASEIQSIFGVNLISIKDEPTAPDELNAIPFPQSQTTALDKTIVRLERLEKSQLAAATLLDNQKKLLQNLTNEVQDALPTSIFECNSRLFTLQSLSKRYTQYQTDMKEYFPKVCKEFEILCEISGERHFELDSIDSSRSVSEKIQLINKKHAKCIENNQVWLADFPSVYDLQESILPGIDDLLHKIVHQYNCRRIDLEHEYTSTLSGLTSWGDFGQAIADELTCLRRGVLSTSNYRIWEGAEEKFYAICNAISPTTASEDELLQQYHTEGSRLAAAIAISLPHTVNGSPPDSITMESIYCSSCGFRSASPESVYTKPCA